MNIYSTGMNPADCNALKRAPRVAIFQAYGAMMDALRANGDTVTWRRTLVGDEFPPDTDAVIVSMLLPRSLNCPYALGAMWAASEALRIGLPLVLYLTDWAFFKATSEYRSIAKAGTPYFSKTIGGALQYNEPPEMIAKHGDQLIDFCRQWGAWDSQLWHQAEISIPKYTNWGDVRIIQDMLPCGPKVIHTFDPSPAFFKYLRDRMEIPRVNKRMDDREKCWLWPSLLNDDTWIVKQRLKWPVDHFGPKGFPVVEDEYAVHKLYGDRVGAICPPYPTVGSGWWRSRWIHAAIAGTILLCDPADAKAVGAAYAFSGNDYEDMSTEQLSLIADEQSYTMWELYQRDPALMLSQIYTPFLSAGAF